MDIHFNAFWSGAHLPRGMENRLYGGRHHFRCCARLRHADEHQECPLIGVDRKGPADGQSDAIDPEQTLDVWPHLRFGPL
jgi:hypothetical protein